MDLPTWLTPHTVSIERFTGEGTHGPVYATASSSRAAVELKATQVRDASGNRVMASTVVRLPLDAASSIPAGSLVTVTGDQARTVIAAQRHEHSGPTPNHWEVWLR
jgi:hypothetical protein